MTVLVGSRQNLNRRYTYFISLRILIHWIVKWCRLNLALQAYLRIKWVFKWANSPKVWAGGVIAFLLQLAYFVFVGARQDQFYVRINFKYYLSIQVHFKFFYCLGLNPHTHGVTFQVYKRSLWRYWYLFKNWTLIHYCLNPLYYPLIILPPQPPDSPLRIPRATQPLNGNPLPQVHLT